MVMLIKEMLSDDNRYKTAIYRRSDGLFEVETCRRTQEMEPESGFESGLFWEPCASRPITDNLPYAERLAREELLAWSGNVPASEGAWIEAEIVFLTASEGGRKHPIPPLSGNQYRPHLVISDPSQRQPKLVGNVIVEEMLGIAFTSGPDTVQPGQLFIAKLQLAYYPYPGYDALVPGTTFTIREGPTIVASGRVLTGPSRARHDSE
jgi:hypothetical protein